MAQQNVARLVHACIIVQNRREIKNKKKKNVRPVLAPLKSWDFSTMAENRRMRDCSRIPLANLTEADRAEEIGRINRPGVKCPLVRHSGEVAPGIPETVAIVFVPAHVCCLHVFIVQ